MINQFIISVNGTQQKKTKLELCIQYFLMSHCSMIYLRECDFTDEENIFSDKVCKDYLRKEAEGLYQSKIDLK
jgi:hypothetical protein